jgi:hypothetical protein
MAYIEPPNPDERGTWHLTRREADCAEGHAIGASECLVTWTWNPIMRHWIIGERMDRQGRYEEKGGCVHANSGWRLADRLS